MFTETCRPTMWNVLSRVRSLSAKMIIITMVIFATTITVLTQRDVVPVSMVQLCVKDNGQLRLTNNNTCDSSERLTQWVVGGQVTDIRFGRGLIGSRENGTVSLAVDPSIFQTCAGCGKIIAGFNDGPVQLLQVPLPEEFPQIAKLDLPAGSYAITAKLVVSARQPHGLPMTTKALAQCKLTAGNDFDRASALLEVEDDRITAETINDEVVLTLDVVHRFAESGEVVLRCSKGFAFGDYTMEASHLKIIAIEGANISNMFLNNSE